MHSLGLVEFNVDAYAEVRAACSDGMTSRESHNAVESGNTVQRSGRRKYILANRHALGVHSVLSSFEVIYRS